MKVNQVVKTNMHFIIPVLVVTGFGLAYNLLGGAFALLYIAGVIGAVYYYSQPTTPTISVEVATSLADELIAEEQAELAAAARAAASSKKVCVDVCGNCQPCQHSLPSCAARARRRAPRVQ